MPEHHPDLIRLDQVSVRFAREDVLSQVSLALHDDCITTLIGPNGAGKTTLVRVVLGLIKPSSGKLWKAPGLRVGYMPQKLHIDRTMPLTVKRFLHIGLKPDSHRLTQTLDQVGAGHLLKNSFHDLSGGETQRVLLARALLRDPQLLVLDEPVQGVDVNGQTELYQLISAIREQRKCGILMISHDLHLVMSSTDHVICLNRHVCCSGHPERVSNDPTFIELFGRSQAQAFALYNHHHDHRHDRLDSSCELLQDVHAQHESAKDA
ncbi:Zinc ABC transporter, ATP-binding protein ZnuC [Nitrincola lacisaponensis]|uniref:Zinc ABC transporter, ATP-binding protein ZnuC n=1 Tax=Nitrincola lacisaponensis TaxID=267850 RepID=A0A063Y9I2_9GAMM|nr:zinc ABC transporter ATP-binding protein ZnuC [Nitrincola lacisaponensis]KDE41376.1 Zinc ABC transporter, ATP-binding protein ZnuC [Nitrincola lacisaponensis]